MLRNIGNNIPETSPDWKLGFHGTAVGLSFFTNFYVSIVRTIVIPANYKETPNNSNSLDSLMFI